MHFYADTHEYLYPCDDVEEYPTYDEEEYLTYDQEMDRFEQTRDEMYGEQMYDDER